MAWQGHRGDQNIKKKLSKIHLKATKLKAVARTLIVGVGYTGLFFKNFTRSSSLQFLFLSFDANDLKIRNKAELIPSKPY